MKKTTILIPEQLRMRASQTALQKGISFGQLAREAIMEYLDKPRDHENTEDPFFSDNEMYEQDTPEDGSISYENALYNSNP